jgi:lipid A 3-O-deacylase
VILGAVLHDRGPASDYNESGLDLNLEAQFAPPAWEFGQWVESLAPMVGVTANFSGDTNVLYAGVSCEIDWSSTVIHTTTSRATDNLFLATGLSLALHDGPLHKDEVGCSEESDCGFGYRVLPRLHIELGTYLRPGATRGVSLFYDHISHKWILPGENEGIDHIGIRYRF